MARPGVPRHRKVLSSGRLAGPAKLTSNKKQLVRRKIAHGDVESGYSLYSTDSEDQVATIHNGLDRCAALLKDILQNESEGIETVRRKPGKAVNAKMTSRPLLSKVNSSKKREPKKNIHSTNVHKEIVPVSNKMLSSVNTTAAVDKDKNPVSTERASVQPIHVPFAQHSPITPPKLCEHVETQMSLLNTQPLQKCGGLPEVPLSIIPDNRHQPVTVFNSRLPTSTPALSPQNSANPSAVQYVSSLLKPPDNSSQCMPQIGPTLGPVSFSASTSTTQGQPITAWPTLAHMPQTAPNNPTAPTVLPPPGRKETTSDQGSHEECLKETDLIRCIQAHLALLQAHDKRSRMANEQYQDGGPVPSQSMNSKGEKTAEEPSEDEDLDDIDMAPVKDTSCQTSFDQTSLKPKNTRLQKTTQKVHKVKYLLGELTALLTDYDDSEILRLLGEVEDSVSVLPGPVECTNVQAEVALALQPLRSENAQLRRRLRILNQQLKDQERLKKECNQNSNFESVSLQSLNMTLQSQLTESMKSIELLQNKNEELIKILESQNEENKSLTRTIHERDQELLEKKQQHGIESTKLKIEADEVSTNMKTLQYKLEAAEKENQILGITVRQRDAEVNRLRELTSALQGSMSKLLLDLTMDITKPKQGKGLSKALLEVHEKQLQPDTYPLSASIMSYLKKLEANPVLINAGTFLSKGEMKDLNQAYDVTDINQSPKKGPVMAEEALVPRNIPSFPKPDTEPASDLNILVEGHKPDETIYIPLTSSPAKKSGVAAKRTDTHHQVPKKLDCNFGMVDSKQPSRFGVVDNTQVFSELYDSHSPKNTTENKLEARVRTAKLERDSAQVQPKGITNEAAKEIFYNPDRRQPGKFFCDPISHRKGSIQKTGTGISATDSSLSTFDCMSRKSEWTVSSFSTFTSQDENDFKNGLAALDANIARLQKTLQRSLEKTSL